MPKPSQNHPTLRLALRLNAGFSTLSALVILLAHAELAELMGVVPPILFATAAGLAAFAGYLAFTAARSDVEKLRSESLQHSLADIAWVVTSIAIVASGVLTEAGNLILGAVALPVLGLGLAQWRALPKLDSAAQAANA